MNTNPAGGATTSDAPSTPLSPGAWDTRSDEALTEPVKAPGTPKASQASPASRAAGRRAGADPVKALMHRYQALCARAVDPLDIAAGLEAHGMTDRTAARFRHRDVFSLAEEMYARVPRDSAPQADAPSPASAGAPASAGSAASAALPGGWAALALVPGAVCALAVTLVPLTSGQARISAALVAALAVAGALRMVLRYGPLRAVGRTVPVTRLWVCWLLGYALLGDGLLRAALAGGAEGPWPTRPAAVLGLALAVGPAVWCARLFSAQAGRRLAVSRGLEDFAAAVWPLLIGVFLLFLAALTGLLLLTGHLLGDGAGAAGAGAGTGAGGAGGALAAAGALGALLLLARLLTVYGFPGIPAAVLGGACAAQALALAAAFAGHLPGCGFIAAPVDAAVRAWGAPVVPAVACGAAALALLAYAARTLTRASAHARPETTR
ncbi:hypothetical protein [Streptomyces apocyni]|uniref:hypothetical protein n=1 Tax=Streptomyces apocyni TaxID=2654677 RepID=UPI001E328F43|nr:hypothetical protein [Streptomyces apocyni]